MHDNTIKTEQSFKCKIRSFVTDNAANMNRMRTDLTAEDADILTYGCSAHIANLLAQDITKLSNRKSILEQIVAVCKYFRNTHLPNYWYQTAGGKPLPLPIHVRWNNYCDTMEAYIKNWPILMKIAEERRKYSSFDKIIGMLFSLL